jgi:hypothetical protein
VLKDPLATDTVSDKLKSDFDIEIKYIPFISLDTVIVLQRAINKLKPPKTIRLSYNKGFLSAKGYCGSEWRDYFLNNAALLAGVDTLIVDVYDIYLDSMIFLSRKINPLQLNFAFAVTALNDDQKQVLENIIIAFNKSKIPLALVI